MLKKAAFAGVGLLLLASPFLASADVISDLQGQIDGLIARLRSLQSSQGGTSQTANMCTAEAKICPDGSAVGRTGQNCQFAPCPGETVRQKICPTFVRTLSRGMRGNDVLQLQQYLGVTPTGFFGPLTMRSLMQFQEGEGLSPVGILGPQTRGAFARRCGVGGGGGGGNERTFTASPTTGGVPLTVTFTSKTPPGGNKIDFGDGTSEDILNWNITTMECPVGVQCNSGTGSISHTYTSAGSYTATLSKTEYNNCTPAPGGSCAGWVSSTRILGTVTIYVGTNATPNIQKINAPATVTLWTNQIAEVRNNKKFYFTLTSISASSATITVNRVGCWGGFPSDPPPEIVCMMYVSPLTFTLFLGQSAAVNEIDISLTNLTTSSATFSVGPTPSLPQTALNCTSDAQCPANNTCEASFGTGTACAMGTNGQPIDPMCVPSSTIIRGSCKVKQGYSCGKSADCAVGNLCHAGICTSPVGRVCSYSNDPVCGTGYKCIQDCGPPVPRDGDPAPGWHCLLNEEAVKPRMCPICLASNTSIATPSGEVNVKNVTVGMHVWTQNARGEKVESTVAKVGHTAVLSTHRVVHLVLADGREVWVSPNHPTADGRLVADLVAGDSYGDSTVKSAESIAYWDGNTYDILPSGETGFYWADGILLGSTLK